MGLKIATAPAIEPVSLEEAKRQLGFEVDTSRPDDELIVSLITAARQHCEAYLNRALITQTWDYYLDAFPAASEIIIRKSPLQSVTYLKYKDADGTLQTWANTNYIVDILSEPGRIALANSISWPVTYDEIQAVQIRFICGYGDAQSDVPKSIRQAILLKLADLFEHRGDSILDPNIEAAIENMLFPERVVTV